MKIDKIYLINLKKNTERFIKIDTLFKSLGGIFKNYTKFEAINGNDLSEKEIKNLLSLKSQYIYNNFTLFMDIKTKGAIGCYLSHIKIWDDARKNNYNNIMIFEDDIYTKLSLNEIMEYINNIPNDYDIAYMDYLCINWNDNNSVNNYWNSNQLDNIAGASAYILNIKGINKLLDKIYPIESQIDCYMSYYANLNKDFKRYIAKEKIFTQGLHGFLGFNSNILNLNNSNYINCIFNEFILTKQFIQITIIIILIILLIKINRKKLFDFFINHKKNY